MGPVAEAAARHKGIESSKSFEAPDGERVTIVELHSEGALAAWAADPIHRAAKARAGEIYEWFRTDITRRVEGLIAEG
jgi:heme-degrading monooxygenase HmoA